MNKSFTKQTCHNIVWAILLFSSITAIAQTPRAISGVHISAWHIDAGRIDWDRNGSVSDSEEWIQLHNRSNSAVNISSWTLRYNSLGSIYHQFASGTILQPGQRICIMSQYRGGASPMWVDANGVISDVWSDLGSANVWLSNGIEFVQLSDQTRASDPKGLGKQLVEITLSKHSGRNRDADECQMYCLNAGATEYLDLGVGTTPCGVDGTAPDSDGDSYIDILDPCPLIFGTNCSTPSYTLPKNRSIDGSGNNPNNPKWGATNIPMLRELPAVYGSSDPNNALGGANRPDPRHISNQLMDEVEDFRTERQISGMAYVWGQFIDHDITRVKGGTEAAPIPVPSYDPFFRSPIRFTRSAVFVGTGTSSPRNQENEITAWIDASMVYGSNAADARWLRTFNNGKLKVSAGNMLPFNTTTGEFDAPIDPTAPKMDDDNNRTKKTFAAGDVRAAENPNLTAFHTIFVREHNRICDRLINQGMSNDEDIYQKARKEVGALIQHFTYSQWLPTLGVSLKSYTGYNPNVRPDILSTFATAAYRWHTMVENDIILRNNNCEGIGPVELPLKNVFFNIDIFRKFDAGVLLRGLQFHPQYQTDIKVNNGLRNFLFGQGSGLDLPSISIQRGRDHGLPDYNKVRQFYTGSGVSNFSSITSNSKLASRLSNLYGGNINNVDLFVGIFAENLLSGTSVGTTLNAIVKKQFESLRDGDYYFYLNDPALSADDKNRISSTTLGQVIERNSNAGNFSNNVFIKQLCTSDPLEDTKDDGTPVCQGSGITAYTYCGYNSGVSLMPGSYTLSALQSRGIANDAISSLKVNIGFAVILYEHDNFSGNSVYYAANEECFPADWNDKVSSLKVICLSNDPSTVNCAGFGGALFDHCFSSPLPISVGTYTTEQLTSVDVKNDKVSAIRVNNGFAITLYEHDNFQGRSITYTGPTVACLPSSWNDITSSVKVVCLSNPTINNCGQSGLAGGIFDSSSDSERFWGISVGIGDYNNPRLNAMGMPYKAISKLQVENGYAFTLFDGDNFSGNSKVFTGKTSSLGGWDNKAISMRVTCLTPPAQYLASKDELALEAKAEVDRARIDWATNMGLNVDYYIIEKFNGNLGDFEPIATVNAVHSGRLESYTQYDNNPQEGDNIYRLKIRFLDGSLKITDHRIVNFKGFADVRIYPNPASDIISIDLSKYLDKDVEVFMYNYLGQQVAYKKLGTVTQPINELDITSYPEGSYLVRIASKSKRDVTKKIVIVR